MTCMVPNPITSGVLILIALPGVRFPCFVATNFRNLCNLMYKFLSRSVFFHSFYCFRRSESGIFLFLPSLSSIISLTLVHVATWHAARVSCSRISDYFSFSYVFTSTSHNFDSSVSFPMTVGNGRINLLASVVV